MEEGRAHPDCINSSNPYHECVDFCFRRILEVKEQKEQQQQVAVPKGEGRVHPECLNSSNPNHVCGFFCFRRLREEGISKFEKPVKVWTTRRDYPNCVNSSNSSHECSGVCLRIGKENVGERKKSLFDLRRANLQEKIRRRLEEAKEKEQKRLLQIFGAKQELIFGGKQVRIFFPDCINSANPYHECSFFCLSMRKQKDRVLQECINSSNPYHECSEFFLQKIDVQANLKNLQEIRSRLAKQQGRVHADCINSSNSYHEYTEFCLQRIAEVKERREQYKEEEEEEEERERHEQASRSGNILDTKEHEPVYTKDLDDEIDIEWEKIDMEILSL